MTIHNSFIYIALQKKYSMKKNLLILLIAFFSTSLTTIAQIYSNGPYYNSTGTGAGGANESVLQTTTYGMSTIGFGQQSNLFNRISDDFTIDCQWKLDSIDLYGYQTGSTTTSTFTSYTLRIWDGVPDTPGSNVIFGDTTTNRLISTTWSGAYRITETTTGNSTRPIMRNTLQLGGIVLPAGTYYLDWAATGSLASGPWQVPITITGQNITGNARQRIGSTWNNLVDGGTGTPAQGAPFDIYGVITTVTANAGMDASVCDNGTIALGGTPTGTSNVASPLTYSWSNVPAADSTLSNPIVTITDPIQFVIMVTDTNGCSATDTIQVAAISAVPVTVSSSSNFMFCPENSTVLVADQTSGITWNTMETNDSIVVNTPGTYHVSYTDGNGCIATDTVEVTNFTVTPVTISPAFPAFCSGQTTLLVADQTNIIWSTTESNDSIYAGTQGNYVVGYTDTNGCFTTDTVFVTELTPPTIEAPDDLAICQGDTVSLIATGGTSYVWDGSLPNGTEVTPTQTTTYTVIGADINSCTNTDSFTVTVSEPTGNTITVTGLDSIEVNSVMYYQDGTYTQTLQNAAGCDSILTVVVQLDFTSINEWDATVSVSPNPMNDLLNIQLTGGEDRRFKLITMMGQLISEFEVIGSKAVDVSELANGSYFIIDASNGQRLLLIKN